MKSVLDHNSRHIFFFFMFVVAFLTIYLAEKYAEQNTCQLKFPADQCNFRGSITREQVTNSNWVNTSKFSLSSMDEFREKMQFGFRHAEFQKSSDIGTVHYDMYDATDIPFGTVAHLSQYFSENTGISDSFWIAVLFIMLFAVFYEAARHLAKL